MLRIALLLTVSVVAFGQVMPQLTGEVNAANLPAHKIGPNDLIAVAVYEAPEFSGTVRVSAEGRIRMPMVQRELRAEGLLPIQMEAVIAETLRSEKLLKDPVVTVTIAEYHSRPISVAGAVNKPVTFQAVGPVTLLDALNRAEGLRPDAGLEIYITTSQPGADGQPVALTRRVPVKGLVDAADPDLNIPLEGGENILVPEIGKIYVVGNVKKPGVFPVQDSSETTVLQMVALAEGLLPFAGKTAYVYRREVSGSKHEIPIDLAKIMERKAPDVPLEADDILYITDRKGKRMTMQVLERAAGFGAGVASGLIIWGGRQ